MSYRCTVPILLLLLVVVAGCSSQLPASAANPTAAPVAERVEITPSPSAVVSEAASVPTQVRTLPSATPSDIAGPSVAPPTEATTPTTQTIPLTIGEHVLEVELASTGEERARGLMFRESLPVDQGMLFVYPNERILSFWMRNTSIPLSIAFLDADKRIINILDMQPFDETSHQSTSPAQYALEVNQGWFAERGIEAGALCDFTLPPDLIIE